MERDNFRQLGDLHSETRRFDRLSEIKKRLELEDGPFEVGGSELGKGGFSGDNFWDET